jgi:hypothetical protein
MLSRIRYAAHVLSSPRVSPYEHADIGFEEEQPVVVSRVSRAIGGLVEVIVLSFVIGIFAAPFLTRVWPFHTIVDVNRTTAIIASTLGILATHSYERIKTEIQNHLKIGEKIAPYFGRKITETYKTLRG